METHEGHNCPDIHLQIGLLQLEFGDTIMAPVKTPGNEGKKLELKTNIYGVKMAKSIPVYRYDITISAFPRYGKNKLRPIEFTKRSKDE